MEESSQNFLIIVADDLGSGEVGAYGNPNAVTPNIDRLAAEGIRFTRFYTAGDVCAPTRASLLTGSYPQRFGFRQPRSPHRGVTEGVVTLPRLMKAGGYATHHIGKWHVGPALLEGLDPNAQGYDSFFGFLTALNLKTGKSKGRNRGSSYVDPFLVSDRGESEQYRGHLSDILTDRALQRIENETRPWFLSLWYFAPHSPPIPPRRWAERFPADQASQHQALVATLDENIGRLLDGLAASGQLERTTIILLSDNGATADYGPGNAPYLGDKQQFFEGSLRVPLIVRLAGARGAGGRVVDDVVSSLDIVPTVAALAGLASDEAFDGESLAYHLTGDGTPPPSRYLFWEIAEGGSLPAALPAASLIESPPDLAPGYDLGVLTPNGRWRLAKEEGRLALFDLEADPTGHRDVARQYPARVAEMIHHYRKWGDDTRRIGFRAEPQAGAIWQAGSARLAGGKQRVDLVGRGVATATGLPDWSFAVGVAPESDASGRQIIAEQSGIWSLARERDGRLSLRALDTSVEAPGPVAGACTVVVVTADTSTPALHFKLGPIAFELHVGGSPAGRIEAEAASVREHLLDVTLLGNGQDGREGFSGQLRKPTLFNVMITPAKRAELSGELCRK